MPFAPGHDADWTRWTKAEKELLREHYPDETLEKLAKRLKRSPSSIRGLASRMQLKKSSAYTERVAREQEPFIKAHCAVCHGLVDLERQDDLCPENPKKMPFIIARQAGGRGSGFLKVPEECLTLEEALADPERRDFALRYIERLQKVAKATELLT